MGNIIQSLPLDPPYGASFLDFSCLSKLLSEFLASKRQNVLPQNLVMSRSREIGCNDDRIALKLDRHLGGAVAEVPVKFQVDSKSLNPNLAAWRLHEVLR